MTLLHIDGLDHYSTAQQFTSGMWTSQTIGFAFGGPTVSIAVGTGGRHGTNGLRVSGTGNVAIQGQNRRTISNAVGSTGIISFSMTCPLVGGAVGVLAIENGGVEQCTLVVNSDGTLTVRRGPRNGTVLGTTTYALASGSTHYFEWLTTISASVGVTTLRVDGVEVLNLTGQNTSGAGGTAWNGYWFGIFNVSNIGGVGSTWIFDDIVVMDGVNATATQGAPFNTFLGDLFVQTIWPTSDGTYLQFTPSSPVAHYTLVDENPPTDDTDYVQDAVVGDRDSYSYIIPTGTVVARAPYLYARKTDAGVRKIRAFSRIGGVDYDYTSANDFSLSTSYLYHETIQTMDPASSSTWSVGTHEIGVKVTA